MKSFVIGSLIGAVITFFLAYAALSWVSSLDIGFEVRPVSIALGVLIGSAVGVIFMGTRGGKWVCRLSRHQARFMSSYGIEMCLCGEKRFRLDGQELQTAEKLNTRK